MEVLFLGTSSMVPTKERNHSGILISHDNEGILVDCGEGTQRQLKIAGIKLSKITKVLISHWHSDHVLGLPGLIQSMAASEYNKTLQVYGPKNTKSLFKKMLGVFVFDKKIKIEVNEIKPGKIFQDGCVAIWAARLKHGVETLGFSVTEVDKRKINLNFVKRLGIPKGPILGKLQAGKRVKWKGVFIDPENATKTTKGKKITIISDTLCCGAAERISKNSDLLVCEATYSSEMENKAREHKHMTAAQAAMLAKKSNSKSLVLTHFSSRYKTTKIHEKEAKKHFKNVVCARDFLRVNV